METKSTQVWAVATPETRDQLQKMLGGTGIRLDDIGRNLELSPKLAWGRDLEVWLRVYSDFVRLKAKPEDHNFIIDLLARLIGDALWEEYPAVDAIALLRAQVRADAEIPLDPLWVDRHEKICAAFDNYHRDVSQGKRPWMTAPT